MKRRGKMGLFARIITLLLAAYLFNFSIDSKDSQPEYISEDLSFNDIESVYEFVLEDILNIENAVSEQDEHDQDDGGSFEFMKFVCDNALPCICNLEDSYISISLSPVDYSNHAISGTFEINSPPPEA